jgi:aldehyde dehydrogenase (NAD+)
MTQIPVSNPRTGGVDYSFDAPTEESLFPKVARLRNNQEIWRRLPITERGLVLEEFATALDRHQIPLAEALSVDTGRWNLSIMEIDALQGITRNRISQAKDVLAERRATASGGGVSHLQVFVPYPVVAVIAPWNYPLILSFLDAVPALLAGCTVIIKPSEVTPRFIEVVHAILADVPKLSQVVEIIAGTPATGESLIKMADAVNFTGSIDSGRRVAACAASLLKPAFLELGGKDPAIVLPGANLEEAAEAIMHCAIVNTGQACFSIERVYVHESHARDFIDRMCSLA